MTNIEKAQNQIEDAKRLLSDAQAQLDALQKAAVPQPWKPQGGRFYLLRNGEVGEGWFSRIEDQLDGAEYPTREAAESAAPYVTFFKRLCCLAAELNPSGKVGGQWYIMQDECGRGESWQAFEWKGALRNVHCVFQTQEAAKQAAETMRRDGWKVPSL